MESIKRKKRDKYSVLGREDYKKCGYCKKTQLNKEFYHTHSVSKYEKKKCLDCCYNKK